MATPRFHRERHRTDRIGWLRAAVLGANDGIVSTASLVLGVAAAGASPSSILLSGVAGTVTAARAISGQSGMGVSYELDAIAAVILGGTSFFGGRGSIWGSLLGAVLITMIRNGMNLMEVSQFKQMMAIGAVVIIAVWIDVIRRQHLLKK